MKHQSSGKVIWFVIGGLALVGVCLVVFATILLSAMRDGVMAPLPNNPPAQAVASTAASLPASTSIPEPTAPPSPDPTPAPPISLDGTGQQVTAKFQLHKGLAIFHTVSQSGRSNFMADLLDDKGEHIAMVANEIGVTDNRRATRIEQDGTYLINVVSDGAWKIVIEQPAVTDAPALTRPISGHGTQVSQFFKLGTGLTTFRSTHKGRGNFIVDVYDAEGYHVSMVANEINDASASKAVGIDRAGIYLLTIGADGDWTVSVTQ